MRSILSWLYLILAFGFIYLPVVVLVLYSFQESGLPVPPFDGPSLKWYDDVFDEWYQMILVELNPTIDTKKISLKKRQLPVHYMNYLYLLHRNHPKEITTNNILSQITTDMNLPIIKILK